MDPTSHQSVAAAVAAAAAAASASASASSPATSEAPGSASSAAPDGGAAPAMRPRASRAPLAHAVMCRFAGAPDFIEVSTLNISQSGMLIAGSALPAVGSALEFKFLLESGFEILSGSGTVMRHASGPGGSPAAGVAFGELDPSQQRILARVIELHSEAA